MSSLVFPLSIPGAQINLKRRPVYATQIQTASSGKELRATWQSYPRYKYNLAIEFLRTASTYAEFQRVMSAFGQVLGQYDSFLIVDPEDNVAVNHGFGVTDGASTAYQLQRTLGGVRQSGLWDPSTYPISSVPRTNMLLNSAFAGTWTATNSGTITSGPIVAPDGSNTEAQYTTGTASNIYSVQQPVAIVLGQPYTFSVWLKYANTQFVELIIDNAAAGTNWSAIAVFDLVNGKLISVAPGGGVVSVSASISAPTGNGYFRCMVTGQPTGSTNFRSSIVPLPNSSAAFFPTWTPAVAQSVYMWGAQLEAGTAASEYIATTTAKVTVNPSYWPGIGDGFEPITEVNPGSLAVYINGVLKAPGTDYTLAGAGVVNFTSAPAANLPLAWSGNYFRRVRFASDELELERIVAQLWAGKTVDFISLK